MQNDPDCRIATCGVENKFCEDCIEYQKQQQWQCPKCKVKFVDVTGECPVCYYRTMAARYGAKMSEYHKTLKLIADLDDAAQMKETARAGINSSVYFNFVEIYADCLLLLIESGAFFERAITFDLPDELVPELQKINALMKTLIKKYEKFESR